MNKADRRAAWRRIDKLTAVPVATVTGKLFDISLIEPERGIQVRLRSTGANRWIPAWRINAALDLSLTREAITPSRLRAEQVTELHASYVAGILRAIAP